MIKLHVAKTDTADLENINVTEEQCINHIIENDNICPFNIERDIKTELAFEFNADKKNVVKTLHAWQVWEMDFSPSGDQVFFVIENKDKLYIGLADVKIM